VDLIYTDVAVQALQSVSDERSALHERLKQPLQRAAVLLVRVPWHERVMLLEDYVEEVNLPVFRGVVCLFLASACASALLSPTLSLLQIAASAVRSLRVAAASNVFDVPELPVDPRDEAAWLVRPVGAPSLLEVVSFLRDGLLQDAD
jgi:hypothetical protein